MTAAEIAKAVKSEAGESLTEAQVYDTIRRDRKGRFDSRTIARPFTYRVKGPE